MHPIAGILGPRQVGKSTLAQHYANLEKRRGREVKYFDLERDEDIALFHNPLEFLSQLKGLVVIDESTALA